MVIVRVVTTITLLATKVMNRFDKGMMYCCKGGDCWSCDNNNPCPKFYGKNIFTWKTHVTMRILVIVVGLDLGDM